MTNTQQEERVYIAGKVSGENFQECFNKFEAVSDVLTEFGYQPLNPMYIIQKGTNWDEAMDILKPHLLNADIILFLPDWQDSHGARLERHWAKQFNKKILEYHELTKVAKKAHENA